MMPVLSLNVLSSVILAGTNVVFATKMVSEQLSSHLVHGWKSSLKIRMELVSTACIVLI